MLADFLVRPPVVTLARFGAVVCNLAPSASFVLATNALFARRT
jgi:hypothetical protein